MKTTYTPKCTAYATSEGVVTHDSADGKNRAVVVAGSPLSQKKADELGIPALDAAAKAQEEQVVTGDPLAELKAAPADAKSAKKTVTSSATQTTQENK